MSSFKENETGSLSQQCVYSAFQTHAWGNEVFNIVCVFAQLGEH